MRVQRGPRWPARSALCAGAMLVVSLPEGGMAQSMQSPSMQFGGEASAQAGGSAGGDAPAEVRAGGDIALSSGQSPSESGQAASAPTHTVTEGDTLWGVSEQYYRDPYAWPRLWSYNPQVTNPHYIYPGDVLMLGTEGNAGAPKRLIVAGTGGPSRRTVSAMRPQTVLIREQAYLDAEALKQTGTIMGSSASHMLLSVSDEAYIEFEEHPQAPVGREFTIFRRYTAKENSPVADDPTVYDPENPGEMVKIVGTAKVLSYNRETQVAHAEIVEALDVIERGFRVADMPRSFLEVTPSTNRRTVESTVVAATYPVQLLGQEQLVFVGAGAEQGVEVGNRFFVVRQEDEWRDNLPGHDEFFMGASRPRETFPDKSQYPELVIGELMVLHTRPQTATAVVTHAIREVKPGDNVRMPDGY